MNPIPIAQALAVDDARDIGRVDLFTGDEGTRIGFSDLYEGLVTITEASPSTDFVTVQIDDIFQFVGRYIKRVSDLSRNVNWEQYVAWPPPPDINE